MTQTTVSSRRGLFILIGLLAVVLLLLFYKSFQPGQALFSNDGPLAGQKAAPFDMPGAFFGIWNNLYWLGSESGSFTPNITGLILLLFGPYGYTNFHPVVSISILGLCGWFFFRRLGFGPTACVLGALAAALNMNFVSNVGWGLSSRALSLAMAFLALAAVESSFKRFAIIKTILAGLAIGMSISEGGDNGAIFSLFIAAYAAIRAWFQPGPLAARLLKGGGRVALMAGCAVLLAAQTLNVFVGTAVKGIVGMEQEERTKAQQWDWATQWSLPKAETLRVVIPGLFGYRMDTPEGGQYWGSVGRYPEWRPEYRAMGARSSGAGEYAGVLVVLIACWGFVQSLRKTKSPFSELERRIIWFWAAAAVVALLLAWGRHAPFYKAIYALPYLSTIRNPMKFMHPFHLAVMILFAYGLQALARRYFETTLTKVEGIGPRFRAWWNKAPAFDKRWVWSTAAFLAVSVLFFLGYSNADASLVEHLNKVGFETNEAREIADFSAREVGVFVIFLALSLGILLLIQIGVFAGPRARWGATLLGLILVVDLVRADTPWIRYYDYKARYTSNPVLDLLKDKPHEARVAVFPLFQGAPQSLQILDNVYKAEWLQHHFLFYDIQSLDVAQEPRMPADKAAYVSALGRSFARYWQLTNTRYILGLGAGFAEVLNNQLAPTERPFVQRIAFDFLRDDAGFITISTNATGPYALIEMTNALPRAKLYSNWQVSTNDQATLSTLASTNFNPLQTVLVADPIAPPPTSTNATAGSAEITYYSPRRIALQVDATAPSILLFNARYNGAWKVTVDGKETDLLRCNFIMRGASVPPGNHTVVFSYEPVITTFYITLGAVLVGLLLCGFLIVAERRPGAGDTTPPASRQK